MTAVPLMLLLMSMLLMMTKLTAVLLVLLLVSQLLMMTILTAVLLVLLLVSMLLFMTTAVQPEMSRRLLLLQESARVIRQRASDTVVIVNCVCISACRLLC
ncbi:hypothetical protein DPMN_174235 [Dreissena polymorpha]|uniref:Uncharacterized protein n=1 Tax=Dreissena polymorpha TaxID=45954 RepID=A0A9D4E513_DREPO|nr:hypothetical protein DPMN_174235 [Dreissena polymorpha]